MKVYLKSGSVVTYGYQGSIPGYHVTNTGDVFHVSDVLYVLVGHGCNTRVITWGQ